MSNNKEENVDVIDDENDQNYKPPAVKSLEEIVQIDQDDESLKKYKEKLLGEATKEKVVVDESNQNFVIVRKLTLMVKDRPDMTLDLSPENLDTIKKKQFTIKEGIQYRVRIDFHVQREIVTGLKYQQKIYRHGIPVEKLNLMVGSYAPKLELQSYTSPIEEMPSGLLARGVYTVKSLFTDDDKNEHLKWEWTFEVKKDWD